jgi:DNA-binding SARP family transcriptional activator
MRDGETEIRILGPVELAAGGRDLRLKGRLGRALVAVLALHVDRMVPGHVLIDALWGEDPPATAEAQVRRQVSWLRRDLGEQPMIVTAPGGYRLRRQCPPRRRDR